MKKASNYISAVFILIQLILLTLILCNVKSENFLSFLLVLISFLHGLIFVKSKEHGYLLVLALFFTVVSDYFLVISYSKTFSIVDQCVAMVSFSIVQLLYFLFIYIKTQGKTKKIVHLIVRISVIIIAELLVLIVLKDTINFLAIISLFYYANLITNIIFSFANGKKFILFGIGLVFFLCCDTLIGLSFLDTFLPFPETSLLYKLGHLKFNLIWLFYGISQTLLSLNVKGDKIFKNKTIN